MASYGARCDYCGEVPCVGEDCPSNWPDGPDDSGLCSYCGRALCVGESSGFCRSCRDDGDGDGGEREYYVEDL